MFLAWHLPTMCSQSPSSSHHLRSVFARWLHGLVVGTWRHCALQRCCPFSAHCVQPATYAAVLVCDSLCELALPIGWHQQPCWRRRVRHFRLAEVFDALVPLRRVCAMTLVCVCDWRRSETSRSNVGGAWRTLVLALSAAPCASALSRARHLVSLCPRTCPGSRTRS